MFSCLSAYFSSANRYIYLHLKCLLNAVVVQEFVFCGECGDLLLCRKHPAVCLLGLQVQVFFFYIEEKTINVYEVVVALAGIFSVIGEEITAVCLRYVQSGLLADFTKDGILR